MAKILIIDDEQQLRGLLARIISLEGYDVTEAADCASGLKALRRCDPDVVLCDVKLPDGNGVEMVAKIKEAAPSAEVILLTAYGNIPDGVQAIKNGAFDYITKGDDNNKILPLLSRAVEKARMQRRLARIDDSLSEQHSFDRIIGRFGSLCAGPWNWSARLPPRTPRCCSRAKREPARRSSPRPFITPVRAREGGFRRGQLLGLLDANCSKASCSATVQAVSREPPRTRKDSSKRPTKARCSSTRSGRCLPNCRPNCSGCSKAANSSRSAKHVPHGSTCA